MIYEARTYQLKPRAVPEFIKLFGAAYTKRASLSKISGFFYTDIGPLNEVIHIWPYRDLAEREKKRARSLSDKKYAWPPKVAHLIEDMRSEIFIPAPFSPTMGKAQVGPIFEWREYQVLPGMMPEMYKNWQKKLAKRTAMSPLVVAMHSELGGLNKFVHVWAYKSLDERAEIRSAAIEKGIWPPSGPRPVLRNQFSKIMLAAPFSPIT